MSQPSTVWWRIFSGFSRNSQARLQKLEQVHPWKRRLWFIRGHDFLIFFARKNGLKDWENLQEHQVRFSDFFHDYVTSISLSFYKVILNFTIPQCESEDGWSISLSFFIWIFCRDSDGFFPLFNGKPGIVGCYSWISNTNQITWQHVT